MTVVAKARIISTRRTPSPPKPKRIWDNYKEVSEVQKTDRIKYVIAAATRDGVRYINIREFYLRQRDLEWKPGRDGITIPIQVPIEKGTKIIEPYEAFVKALLEAKTDAESIALADEDNAVWYMPKEKKV